MNRELFLIAFNKAYADMFRTKVFSHLVDNGGHLIDIKKILSAIRTLNITKKASDETKLKTNEDKIYSAQLMILAYLEQESSIFYNRHGQTKSYLDQFAGNAKFDPDMDDIESIEYLILDMIKTHEEFDILRQAIMGILMTSATSTRYYNDESAERRVISLFDLDMSADLTDTQDTESTDESDEDGSLNLGRLQIRE